jgi:hypothetical protein
MQSESSNRVLVSYCVDLSSGVDRCLGEDELRQNFNLYCSSLAAERPIYGAILVQFPGQPEVRIEDEVWVLVQQLCFKAVSALVTEQTFVYSCFSYDGQVVLISDGASVQISGDLVPQVTVPRDQLLEALYECGQRFVQLLFKISRYAPDHEATAKHLAMQSVQAKISLRKQSEA